MVASEFFFIGGINLLEWRKGRKCGWEETYPDTTYAFQAHFILIVFIHLFVCLKGS